LPRPADRAAAKGAATKVLAARGPDLMWDGPRGKMVETAKSLVVLAAAHKVTEGTAAGRAPAGAPKPLPKSAEADRQQVLDSLARGGAYLLSKCKHGRFEGRPGQADAGITALAIGAMECVPEPRPKEMQQAIDEG